MKVSVVTIAKTKEELKPLMEKLKHQTFQDFEFVYSTKKGIPQAWNDVFKRAKGEIIITTESDAVPLTKTWLEEMVSAVEYHDQKTLIRGIEVSELPWCWCNIGCHAPILKNNLVDETYPISEDAELFSRLKKLGYRGIELPIGPVKHSRRKSFRRKIVNSFIRGKLNTQLYMKYGQVGFKKPHNLDNQGLLKRELGIILSRIAFVLGALLGYIKGRFT